MEFKLFANRFLRPVSFPFTAPEACNFARHFYSFWQAFATGSTVSLPALSAPERRLQIFLDCGHL
jgi:hypothetical protein